MYNQLSWREPWFLGKISNQRKRIRLLSQWETKLPKEIRPTENHTSHSTRECQLVGFRDSQSSDQLTNGLWRADSANIEKHNFFKPYFSEFTELFFVKACTWLTHTPRTSNVYIFTSPRKLSSPRELSGGGGRRGLGVVRGSVRHKLSPPKLSSAFLC